MSSPSAILRYALSALLLVLLVPLGWTASSCLERKNDLSASGGQDRCASCHGDPKRPGDYLLRSAPPSDLVGGEDPSFPGVGAHQIHLNASSTHGAVACSECHVVPERSDAPGHADHGSPATLVFGSLASENGTSPSYDIATRRCTNSYCHGARSGIWSEPRSSARACGSCHGLPPPLPHPQSDRCSVCHAAVVDSERHFVAPELHVNGQVDYAPGACTTCHGAGQDPAPPLDTQGNSSPSAPGVGAHQAHLASSLGRSLACSECHRVPGKVEDPDHIIGLPARVQLLGVAASDGKNPVWQAASRTCADTYCHSPTPGSSRSSPSWTDSSSLSCTSCHGAPPPAPHPQMAECSLCHAQTVGTDNHTIIDLARHADGIVDVAVPSSCTACHGSGSNNPAPPTDLEGNTLTSAAGVGAHQTHVRGTARSRPVPCAECHLVPKTVLDPGHLDSARPAELIFSGAAVAFGATPTYANGTCQNTACHGAQFPNGHASGGAHTAPNWTRVDGTEAACGTCHGLPPPPPHPLGSLNPTCNACHKNIAADNVTFIRADLHADGVVTFDVP